MNVVVAEDKVESELNVSVMLELLRPVGNEMMTELLFALVVMELEAVIVPEAVILAEPVTDADVEPVALTESLYKS